MDAKDKAYLKKVRALKERGDMTIDLEQLKYSDYRMKTTVIKGDGPTLEQVKKGELTIDQTKGEGFEFEFTTYRDDFIRELIKASGTMAGLIFKKGQKILIEIEPNK